MKMLLCCDIIALVQRKHKHLKIQRSKSANRATFTRDRVTAGSGAFTMLSHDQGKQSYVYYERAASTEKNSILKKSESQARASRKKHCPKHQPELHNASRSRSASSKECYRSLESYERLTGSISFRKENRHRKQSDNKLSIKDSYSKSI